MYVCAHVVVRVTQLNNNNAHTQSLAQAVCTCNSCTSVDARELMRVRSRPRRTSRTAIIGLRMPNGHREPFRIHREWGIDGSRYRSPSPEHSSDTEDTYAHKQRWRLVARRVFCRWQRYVYERGIRRRREWLRRLFFRHEFIHPTMIPTIARFVGPFRIHETRVMALRIRVPTGTGFLLHL